MYNTDMPTRAELPTNRQLFRSTLIAIVTAAALLVTVVLPAEYAIDPTGIGKVLGLAEMGEIKVQLAEEAERDAKIEVSIDDAMSPAAPNAQIGTLTESVTEPSVQDVWQDTIVLTLKPGEAAEIKLEMNRNDPVIYEWTTSRGHLNSDLHADGTAGEFTSYRKGRKEVSDAGRLTAAFDGAHGWFWRNRSSVDVEVTLQVKGTYGEIRRVV
tara:strand:+ start:257 stop:892 length:636 start_codon:yes stop_codon:yes gene_type:complete